MKTTPIFRAIYFILLFNVYLCGLEEAHGQEVRASLTPEYLEIGQTGTLTLTFINAGQIQFNSFKFPTFQGFRIPLQSPSTESRISNSEVTVNVSFQVIPTKPGDWEIPSFTFSLGQKKLSSNSIKFKIYPRGKSPVGELPTDKIAFIKITPKKKRVFIGESFPVKVNLYYDERCLEKEWPVLESVGFNLEYKQLGDTYRVNIGNRRFGVTETTRIATALKTGELLLGPATSDVKVPVGNSPRIGLFSRRITENYEAKGEPITITSLELPTSGRPSDFNGLVGSSYVMTYSASPKEVKVGDPVTVKIEIGGKGNISSIQLPEDFNWDQFKTYEPKSDSMIANKVTMEGRKNFEMVVIPKSENIESLPDLRISYFDPDQIKYVTMNKPGPRISVSAGSFNASSSNLSGSVNNQKSFDAGQTENSLTHIEYKQTPTPIGTVLNPIGNWVWLTPLASFLFMICTFGSRWIHKLIQTSGKSSQKYGSKEREQDINRLEELSETNDVNQFCSQLFRVLQQDIGQATNIPFESITSDVIQKNEIIKNMSSDLKLTLNELFTMCDNVRYGIQEDSTSLPKALDDYLKVSQEIHDSMKSQKK